MLNQTTHKSDTFPQATFPILEHSVSSASTLTPLERHKLFELLKESDDVLLSWSEAILHKYSGTAFGDSKRHPSLALLFTKIKQHKNGNTRRMC